MQTATQHTNDTIPTLFENRYYTKKELARTLRVGLRMIDNMMANGELKVIRLGRAVRFNGIELNKQFCK